MARPIKETPVLKGKTSREFNSKLAQEASKPHVPAAERERILSSVKTILGKSTLNK